MSEPLTLTALAAPLRLLRVLAADFPNLPAPDVDVSTVFPDHLRLRFHGDFAAFEAWREALVIPSDAITYKEQSSRTRVLTALTEYSGAALILTGYSEIPAPVRGVAA
ncbi:hypothetical protein [Streptomyces albipurpureus]|uniref:Uncharacterized protein n=1 Tax=Streptomyces albipurpureus TaxID=2897419 RepID=A0ABT0UVT1_9ACTN|nr:hypothetical protein [Streptomyces sp. CWNU-1]MCM2392507.1 hypothetical protein [Streptomyces sp. CWNU-1]